MYEEIGVDLGYFEKASPAYSNKFAEWNCHSHGGKIETEMCSLCNGNVRVVSIIILDNENVNWIVKKLGVECSEIVGWPATKRGQN